MRSWTSPALPTLPPHVDEDGERRVMLYDTVREEIVATGGPETTATLYVCGITPYDATHLGHATTYLTFDLLQRTWRDQGRKVVYVQNVTDVDDPLLERAQQTGVDWRELAEDQTDLFRSDMEALRVLAPDHYIGAVESVPLVVEAVSGMLAQDSAYRVDTPDVDPDAEALELGDVYADFATDPRFAVGQHLQGMDLPQVFAENGGDPERPGKRGVLDALLWRRRRTGEPFWDGGDLGEGRPGWHVECAGIAREYLGDHIEVQGGGRDLVFPHHEMSESHLRAFTGQDSPISLHAHVGMVAYEGTKMSKSLGNLVLVSRLVAQGVEPAAIRLLVHAHHYRSDWEYTDADLQEAQERLALWRRAVALPAAMSGQALLAAVRAALAEDLDAPTALVVIDRWARHSLHAYEEGGAPEANRLLDSEAPGLARTMADALLGIEL